MEPYESRRKHLLQRLHRGVAVFPSAPVTIRNNDVEHDYRQDSDFYYLTGLEEPDAALVLSTVHPELRSVVFVRPRNPEREHWEGPRLGVDEAAGRLGVDAAYSIDELSGRLPDFLQNAQRLVAPLGTNRTFDELVLRSIAATRARWKAGVSWPTEIIDPVAMVHEMRLYKDEHELAIMRRAAAVTVEAHRQAMQYTRPGQLEYEIEANLSHTYRMHGSARHAFQPIVASGANATVPHYVRNNRRVQENDLALIDSGCELDGYASDLTRTFPASGKFTPEQRRLYDIVAQALREATAMARPGTTLEALHRRVCEVLTDGLLELGLLTGSRDEILETHSYKRFYPHRTSHWLGMDVHDVGRYFIDGKPRKLEPGMVFTIEPGLYIPTGGDQAPKPYQGIGIRLEDNVVITEDGAEVLSAALPREADDVEAICAR